MHVALKQKKIDRLSVFYVFFHFSYWLNFFLSVRLLPQQSTPSLWRILFPFQLTPKYYVWERKGKKLEIEIFQWVNRKTFVFLNILFDRRLARRWLCDLLSLWLTDRWKETDHVNRFRRFAHSSLILSTTNKSMMLEDYSMLSLNSPLSMRKNHEQLVL